MLAFRRTSVAAALVAVSLLSVVAKAKLETVYITDTGKKFHRSGCRYLSKSKIAIEKDQAIKKHYSACSVCTP